jgi:predicted double-glycine peptidase
MSRSNRTRFPVRAYALALLLGVLPGVLPALGAAVAIPGDIPGGPSVVPVKSMRQLMLEMRYRSTIPQQYDYSCGAAAISTLLTFHYGRPVGERDIVAYMYARGDQPKILKEGFSLLDMKNFLELLGYSADGFEIEPGQLDQLIAEGVPFIALIRDSGYNHFVVVKGANATHLLIGDSAKGGRIVRRAEFEAIWDSRIAFLIHSHQNGVRFNVPSDWNIAPRASLGEPLHRDSLANSLLMRPGHNDF